MSKIFICDDDLDYLAQVEQLIHTWAEYNGHLVTVFTFDNGDQLLACQKREKAILMLKLYSIHLHRSMLWNPRDCESVRISVETYQPL